MRSAAARRPSRQPAELRPATPPPRNLPRVRCALRSAPDAHARAHPAGPTRPPQATGTQQETQLTSQPPALAEDPRTVEILDLFAKAAGTDRAALRLDANVTELGIESLDMVQAVFELETRYNIDIPLLPDQPGGAFGTVGDLVRMVLQRLDQPSTA